VLTSHARRVLEINEINGNKLDRQLAYAMTSHYDSFFHDKVAGVRDATAGAPASQFTAAPVGCELRFFRPVTPTEVIKLVQALPDKQCSSDPAPTGRPGLVR